MLEAIRVKAGVSPLTERRQEDRQTLDTVCLSSCHLLNVGLALGKRGGRGPRRQAGREGLALWTQPRHGVHPLQKEFEFPKSALAVCCMVFIQGVNVK